MAEKGGDKPALRKPEFVKIKDLERGRSGYNVYVKVTEAKERQVDTKDGQKITMVDAVVADETGAAKAFFKGEQAKGVKEGAVIAIRNGVKKIIKGHISLELDLFGRVTVENVDVKPGNEKNISDEEIKFEPRRRDERRPRQGFNRGGERRGGPRGERRGGDREDRGDREGRRDDRREDRRPREDRGDRGDREGRRDDRNEERRTEKREDRRNDDRREDRGDRRPERRDDRRDFDNRGDRDTRRGEGRRNYDRDYDRRGGDRQDREDRGDRDHKPRGGFQEKRPERGERKPMLKINEIDPGSENIRFIAKVLTAALVANNRGNNIRCQLGDETGVVNAFLPESEHLVVGKTVALFAAEARVVREHIEIQRARVELARTPIDKVNDKFNLSEKAWIPVD